VQEGFTVELTMNAVSRHRKLNRPIPAGDDVKHFDPELPHHRAWLLVVLEQLVAHEPQALEEGATLRRLWTAYQAAAGAGPAPVADIPAAVAVALPLEKEFEGCRLKAYPNPEFGVSARLVQTADFQLIEQSAQWAVRAARRLMRSP
jgi:hypothetical protein